MNDSFNGTMNCVKQLFPRQLNEIIIEKKQNIQNDEIWFNRVQKTFFFPKLQTFMSSYDTEQILRKKVFI